MAKNKVGLYKRQLKPMLFFIEMIVGVIAGLLYRREKVVKGWWESRDTGSCKDSKRDRRTYGENRFFNNKKGGTIFKILIDL
ncbi:hypothetical protein D3Z55_01440 [Clostridiaceae bacterium]|jgi:hypothetical protein|nr:hypothetical protein [Lachnospiraceae bacterium]NBH16162.1 hypothetical protein [Clostridiaceae bacterium]